jgi:hypothetical protein
MDATMPGMTLAPNDRGRYRADVAAYEAYCYDGKIIDGIRYDYLGIEERVGGREVLRGTIADLLDPPEPMDRVARVPVTIRLTKRVPDLSIERAADLIRNAFFHCFLAHDYCQHIAEIVVEDETDGTSYTAPFDQC